PPTLGAPRGTRGAPRSLARLGPRQGPPASSSEGGYAPLGLPRPTLGSPRGTRSAPRSLADPLHVAVHRDLTHGHDLAVLYQDPPRGVGRSMVLGRVRERRRDPPRVELAQALERLLERLARQRVTRALDRFDGHDHPQPAAHVRRRVRVVGVVLLVELH